MGRWGGKVVRWWGGGAVRRACETERHTEPKVAQRRQLGDRADQLLAVVGEGGQAAWHAVGG